MLAIQLVKMTLLFHMKACQFASVGRIIKFLDDVELLKKDYDSDEMIEL